MLIQSIASRSRLTRRPKCGLLTAVLFFLLYFVFALYERKNEVQKMVSTLLPYILGLPALRHPLSWPALSASKGRRACRRVEGQAIQHSFGPCERSLHSPL